MGPVRESICLWLYQQIFTSAEKLTTGKQRSSLFIVYLLNALKIISK